MDVVGKQIISNTPSFDGKFINECIEDMSNNIEEVKEEIVEEMKSYEKLLKKI